MTAIRQKGWPPVVRFASCRIERRHDGRHAASAGHPQEGAVGRWREQNDVVAAPAPAAPVRRVTQHNRWSAGDLRLSSVCQPRRTPMNRLSGDQKGKTPPSVPGIGLAARVATGRSQIWYAELAPATNTMFWPSGETATWVAVPVPRDLGPPNDVFSGGAIVNTTGPAAGATSPARRSAMNAVAASVNPRASTPVAAQGSTRCQRERAYEGSVRTGCVWRTVEQFLNLNARVADVPHPRLRILFQATSQQPAEDPRASALARRSIRALSSRPTPA